MQWFKICLKPISYEEQTNSEGLKEPKFKGENIEDEISFKRLERVFRTEHYSQKPKEHIKVSCETQLRNLGKDNQKN